MATTQSVSAIDRTWGYACFAQKKAAGSCRNLHRLHIGWCMYEQWKRIL